MSEIKKFICFDENIYREKEIIINTFRHDNWTVTKADSVSHDLYDLNPIQKMGIKRKASKRIKEIGKSEGLVCSTMLPISGAGFQNIVITQNCILLSNDYSLINSVIKSEDLKKIEQEQPVICRKNLCSTSTYSDIEKELVNTANTYYKLMNNDSGSNLDYIDILVYLNHMLTPSRRGLYTESENRVKQLNKIIR